MGVAYNTRGVDDTFIQKFDRRILR